MWLSRFVFSSTVGVIVSVDWFTVVRLGKFCREIEIVLIRDKVLSKQLLA